MKLGEAVYKSQQKDNTKKETKSNSRSKEIKKMLLMQILRK